MQCRAWLGASVATNTASIVSSLTSSSSDGYVFSQRQAFASSLQRSGNRSLTAATVTFGWSWKPNAGPELADAVADDAHADLPIGDRLPNSLGAFGRLRPGLAQDFRVGGLGVGRDVQRSSSRSRGQRTETDIAEERAS